MPQNDLQELKARTLRHYVGHATKQIEKDTKEAGRTKGPVSDYFKARVAKRQKGIAAVHGKQLASAEKRAASASAKIEDLKAKAPAKEEPKTEAAPEKKTKAPAKAKKEKVVKEENKMQETYVNEQAVIAGMVRKVVDGDSADAVVEFDALMDSRINNLLNDRSKELAAQLFGPSIVATEEAGDDEGIEVEMADEDDEVADVLQDTADEALAELEAELAEEGVEPDLAEFVTAFNESLSQAGIDEYIITEASLWRPEKNGTNKKGIVVASVKKKEKTAAEKIVNAMDKHTYGHNR